MPKKWVSDSVSQSISDRAVHRLSGQLKRSLKEGKKKSLLCCKLSRTEEDPMPSSLRSPSPNLLMLNR